MDFKISCSFGEVVDKYSILKIKESKIKNTKALKNIKNEIQALENDVVSLSTFITNNTLYQDLLYVNKKLWVLEDLIRDKSKNRNFDNKYIEYAESIHETNDKRYIIKREINNITNSKYVEEKSHNFERYTLERAKTLYHSGKYDDAYKTINTLTKNLQLDTPNIFNIELLISAQNIYNIIGHHDQRLLEAFHKIIKDIEHYGLNAEFITYCKNQYCLICLKNRLYTKAYPYLNFVGVIRGPQVSMFNMSIPNESEQGKNVLIYDGGGIGDKFMLCRFIPDICEKYQNHTITFFLNDNIIWIIKSIFHNIKNLKIVPYSNPRLIGHIDHHFNLMMSLKVLNIQYEDLKFTPLFKNVQTNTNKEIEYKDKKTYVLNWKGNPNNIHEQHNRRMDLSNAIPLFKRSDIYWIVITKDINVHEAHILKKYNVMYLGNIIDLGKDCFYDSIELLRHVSGVITTDTSIAHLSLNLDVPTHVLLTKGNEWRWAKYYHDATTLWYPNAKLYIQKQQGVWKDVIDNVLKSI